MNGRPNVVVVGGGISGLTVAYRLLRDAPDELDVTLLEADDRLGGKLRTIEVAGAPVEAGADSFVVRKPWAVYLCGELGLEDRLVVPSMSRALVWTGGRLVPFPADSPFGIPARPSALLRWPGIPLRARVRAAAELLLPSRRPGSDEALASLLRRRLGDEASRALVEPLLAGLHAGDPMRLSVEATFPELAAWERQHGSLIRGARAAVRKARGSAPGALFATVWGGLSGLVDALGSAVGPERIREGTPVSGLHRDGRGYVVVSGAESFPADAIVISTPAFEAARLLLPVAAPAARDLAAIPYASTAVVILVYPEGTGSLLPNASGFIVPFGERVVTACTWVSRKWEAEGFGDRAVMRCFVGRAGADEPLALPDDALVKAVRAELEEAVPIEPEPEEARVMRWQRAMPQYEVGHLDRVEAVEQSLRAESPGLFVTGSAYRGIGIADCVRQASEVAGRVRAELLGHPVEPIEEDEQESMG